MAASARGRPTGSTEKPWRDALRLAVNAQGEDGRKKLRLIAEKVVDLAMAGDVTAIREIGDRMDGKPRQEADVTIHDNRDPNSLSDADLAAVVAGDGGSDDAATESNPGVVH